MVQADLSRKAGVDSYDADSSQAKALTQGVGGKRNFGAAFGQAGHGGGKSNAGGNGGSGGSGNAGGAHKAKECYACGRLGHIRDNCHAKKHKNGGPIREYAGKNKTQENNGGNNQKASSGQSTRVISAVDARQKFENRTRNVTLSRTRISIGQQTLSKWWLVIFVRRMPNLRRRSLS